MPRQNRETASCSHPYGSVDSKTAVVKFEGTNLGLKVAEVCSECGEIVDVEGRSNEIRLTNRLDMDCPHPHNEVEKVEVIVYLEDGRESKEYSRKTVDYCFNCNGVPEEVFIELL